MPQRETEIGPIPARWRVVRLGEVVKKTRQIDLHKKPDWSFRYVDVSSIDNESLRITSHQNFTGKEAPSRARKQISAGDVLFATVRPYLRRIAIVPSELDGHICSTAFCVLRWLSIKEGQVTPPSLTRMCYEKLSPFPHSPSSARSPASCRLWMPRSPLSRRAGRRWRSCSRPCCIN